ncbi:MAG: hypothetical protein EA415_09850 [Sphaerobacteraceae bacterium]|nr:MAG: hypothetical protein EA415_09850 [Sphaerobacteraceae bacterium]
MSQDAQVPDTDTSTDIAVPVAEPAVAPVHPLTEFGITIPSTAPIAVAERDLNIGGEVVFALDVARIDRAESFYHDLFQLDIICRAWRQDDGSWQVSTDEVNWARELINGYYPELVVLQRPRWTLVLHGIGRGQVLTTPKLGDAEVPVSPAAMRKLRAKILMKSYTVVTDEPDRFAFRDPFAMVWTLIANESLSN